MGGRVSGRPDPPRAAEPAGLAPRPNQAPVITRQRAELTRLRATSLCQTGHRVYEQAKRLHQSAQALHALLQKPPEGPDPDHAIGVGPRQPAAS